MMRGNAYSTMYNIIIFGVIYYILFDIILRVQ